MSGNNHRCAINPLESSVGDKRVSYVKGLYGVNITCRTTLALYIYIFGNLYNSVAGYFGVEYTRKVLLGRRVNDEGLRRAVCHPGPIAGL